MTKKYEFTGETKILTDGTILHRIRAIININLGSVIINVGDLGGWIEKEENLSHDGIAWVYGDAMVYGNARVYNNAMVYNNARVFGNAWVFDNVEVYGNAKVYGDAKVSGNARVFGNAWVNKTEHYLVIGPIGSRNKFTTFFRSAEGIIKVACGCFYGTIDEFRDKVKETHGDSKCGKVYHAAISVALAQIEDVDTEELND